MESTSTSTSTNTRKRKRTALPSGRFLDRNELAFLREAVRLDIDRAFEHSVGSVYEVRIVTSPTTCEHYTVFANEELTSFQYSPSPSSDAPGFIHWWSCPVRSASATARSTR